MRHRRGRSVPQPAPVERPRLQRRALMHRRGSGATSAERSHTVSRAAWRPDPCSWGARLRPGAAGGKAVIRGGYPDAHSRVRPRGRATRCKVPADAGETHAWFDSRAPTISGWLTPAFRQPAPVERPRLQRRALMHRSGVERGGEVARYDRPHFSGVSWAEQPKSAEQAPARAIASPPCACRSGVLRSASFGISRSRARAGLVSASRTACRPTRLRPTCLDLLRYQHALPLRYVSRAQSACAVPWRRPSPVCVIYPCSWGARLRPGAAGGKAAIRCASSTDIDIEPASLDAVFTDPPYFGNVQ